MATIEVMIPFWAKFCIITICILHFGQRPAASDHASFTDRILQYASTARDSFSRRATPLLLPLHQGFLRSSSQLALASPLRRNLREARMWLYGHVLSQGYYYANVWLGSPPQQFALIVDTGSTVTYVPCATCSQCGKHQDLPFDASNSSSFADVKCGTDDCLGHQCDTDGRCAYARHYAEDSSSSGIIASDLVSFGAESDIPPTRILFGCELKETGDLYSQKADGIVGLGQGPLSIVNQLAEARAMEPVFSLCYGGMDAGGGAMVLGKTDTPDGMEFTPLDPKRDGSTYYNVVVDGISVAGKRLRFGAEAFEGGYGAVFDSGTTFAYLPSPVFDAFHKEITSAALSANLTEVDGPDPNYKDLCFGGASDKPEELSLVFPEASFAFSGGVNYQLAPENYLFRHSKVSGAYCLGFFRNADGGALLGGILVRNTMVTYDRVNGRIGLWKTNCGRLFESLHSLEGEGGGGGGAAEAPPLPEDLVAEPPPLPDTNRPATQGGEGEGGENEVGSADNTTSPSSCSICAAVIRLQLLLSIPPATLAGMLGGLQEDMAREIGFQARQISIDAYGPGSDTTPPPSSDSSGSSRDSSSSSRYSSVNVSITPVPPATTFDDEEVKRVHKLLDGGLLATRDIFGKVVVLQVSTTSIDELQGSWSSMAWLAGVILLSAAVLLLGLVLWALFARQQRLARQAAWTDINQSKDNDEEQGLANAEEEDGEAANLVDDHTELETLPREGHDDVSYKL